MKQKKKKKKRIKSKSKTNNKIKQSDCNTFASLYLVPHWIKILYHERIQLTAFLEPHKNSTLWSTLKDQWQLENLDI